MARPPFNLILLGDPGAGKATQGARLVKKYPLREFDFGQWLRDLKGAERRRYQVDDRSGKGILAPTDLAKRRFRDVIMETPPAVGVFFNGNPKMLGEAKVVAKAFKESGRSDVIALYLSIPRAEMLQRLQSRAGQRRNDDEERALKNRMKYYKEHIAPTVGFLRRTYPFAKIDGVGSEAEVFRRIVAAVSKLRA